MTSSRFCKQCNVEKTLGAFEMYVSGNRRRVCIQCRNENIYAYRKTERGHALAVKYSDDFQRKHHKELIAYHAAYRKARPHRTQMSNDCNKRRTAMNKSIVDEAKARPCADCGGTFPPCSMDFDHVRGSKLGNIGAMRGAPVAEHRLLEEMAKCEVVCSNCHRVRTLQRAQVSGWPAGSRKTLPEPGSLLDTFRVAAKWLGDRLEGNRRGS